jgi:hypothetical protein
VPGLPFSALSAAAQHLAWFVHPISLWNAGKHLRPQMITQILHKLSAQRVATYDNFNNGKQ